MQSSYRTEHVASHQGSYRIVSYFSSSVQLTKALPRYFGMRLSGVSGFDYVALLVFCAPHNFRAASVPQPNAKRPASAGR
jgi:hypothetical protein